MRTCRNCRHSVGDSSGALICLLHHHRLIPSATTSVSANRIHDMRLQQRAFECPDYVREPGAD